MLLWIFFAYTANLVKCQVVFTCKCTVLGFPIAEDVKEKGELETILMWGKFFFDRILDCEIFIYLKNWWFVSVI